MRVAASITLLVVCMALPAAAGEITGRASVVDGDTIEIRGERIRFDGVDAPESKQICNNAAGRRYRCGQVSATALDVFLEKSRPVTCQTTGKSYDRIVAVCRRADGAEVNSWLVANGFAVDWPKYSNGRYAAQQKRAKGAKLGIWAGEFEMPCAYRGRACN
jgi:endonuclease YncB( thermonuclease family)